MIRASVESRRSRVTVDVQDAAAVDRPSEHLVALALVDRQRLAGDRRLVDVALARVHAPVERNLLSRAGR